MIKNFLHKGAQAFFERGTTRGIDAAWSKRLQDRLTVLDDAQELEDINLPGWRLHPLKGNREGTWALQLTRNFRVTFRFETGDVVDVNIEDYHEG